MGCFETLLPDDWKDYFVGVGKCKEDCVLCCQICNKNMVINDYFSVVTVEKFLEDDEDIDMLLEECQIKD